MRLISGTTSACAENTRARPRGRSLAGNYLRVRGEYNRFKILLRSLKELPPRARRIPPSLQQTDRTFGTTSACAENTRATRTPISTRRNYLRVRGEYPHGPDLIGEPQELPPRARRIPAKMTPTACRTWNYLRVRGEYPPFAGC